MALRLGQESRGLSYFAGAAGVGAGVTAVALFTAFLFFFTCFFATGAVLLDEFAAGAGVVSGA